MGYERTYLASDLEPDDTFGELGVAEYVVFLMAYDTYVRYLSEHDIGVDDIARHGLALIRMADRLHQDRILAEFDRDLPSNAHKKMLAKAFRFLPTINGLSQRALWLRTTLDRGGAGTQRAVFQTNRALLSVRAAMQAASNDDADAALDKFAVISIRNARFRAWIELAAKTAGSGTFQNPVAVGAEETSDAAAKILTQRIQQQGSSALTPSRPDTGTDDLARVQTDAAEAARKAMGVNGDQDTPPNRSEVVGIATAAAVAAMSDPGRSANIPEPLRKLDDEQRAAALTDGKVLVAAGAGAGKSSSLVARVEYLVKDRKVLPSRVLVTSFNKKAANELQTKIGKAVGQDSAQQMSIGTMHGLFRKFIMEFGTVSEQAALSKGMVQGGGIVAGAVNRAWAQCFAGTSDESPPKAKTAMRYKTLWAGNNISPKEAQETARTAEEKACAIWYAFYEGFKGSIPGWLPPDTKAGTSPKEWEAFLGRKRPGGMRLADFDDMLSVFRDILKRDSGARKKIQGMYDHIIIDECVHEDTEVVLRSGESKRISELDVGEEVQSYQNGAVVFKRVLAKKRSSKASGVTLFTKAGRRLTMTLDHRLYATPFDPATMKDGELALYLMYRQDLGYRIGVSSIPYLLGRSTKSGSFRSHRAGAEKADCLWVLEVGASPDILFKELDYSLQYQIPARIFEAAVRGCDQERSDRIFAKYGQNGEKLLQVYGLHIDYPHWTSSSSSDRKVLHIAAHRPGGHGARSNGRRTTGNVSWTAGVNEPDVPATYTVYKTHGGSRKAVHVSDSSYIKAAKKARALAHTIGARVTEDILVQNQSCMLTNAGSLHVGMSVPVHLSGMDRTESVTKFMRGSAIRKLADQYHIQVPAKGCVHASLYAAIREAHLKFTGQDLGALDDSVIALDEIVGLEPIEDAVFYDIAVEDTGNFFGNGVLSHNCQDSNTVQNDIIDMLSEHIGDGADGKSLWIVGDPNQAIYGFRGAKPELFVNHDGQEGWKTRLIRTNYRCEPEIVEAANKLIGHNESTLKIEANPDPRKSRGVGSVVVKKPSDDAEAALSVVEAIKSDVNLAGANVADYAILCRTNNELHAYETACIIRGIPYARKGKSSFLGSPETTTFLGYVQMITGADATKMQAALQDVINKPNRFFIAEDAGKAAVEAAFTQYAVQSGYDRKTLNPVAALESNSFRRLLAGKLTGTQYGFKFDKAVQQLAELSGTLTSLRAASAAGEVDTRGIFDEILNLNGTAGVTDPRTGDTRWVRQTFRESLQQRLREATGGDDDVEDEEEDPEEADMKGLGNIGFLYKLAQVDPTEPADVADPPTSPLGFKAKMDRMVGKMRDLRIDLDKWEKDQEALPPEQRKAPPGVYCGTVHATKGAQWLNCFVQMPAKKFPMQMRVRPGDPPPPPEEVQAQLEEERRLAYVGLTRAARNLTIVCPSLVGGRPAGVSSFVAEAGLKLGENVEKPISKQASDEYEGLIPDQYGLSSPEDQYGYGRS